MKRTQRLRSAGAFALAAALTAAPVSASDALAPGSVLVFPRTSSGGDLFTAVSITNTNLLPITPVSGLGGSTNVHFEYVVLVGSAPAGAGRAGGPSPDATGALEQGVGTEGELHELGTINCLVGDVVELLTPADTLTVATVCHNPAPGEGYLVVSALDPNTFQEAWSHNHLIGSEFVLNANGSTYALPAIPFRALANAGEPTDVDQDGQLDFDGVEYEGVPDELYADSFVASAEAQLVLVNWTGGASFDATVGLDIWNDNEFPLTQTLTFACWMEEALADISLSFEEGFLLANTPHDPGEADLNCDGVGDVETGWFRIRGLVTTSPFESQLNPALLGALTGLGGLDDGRPLWRSLARQLNGDFQKYGSDDPEWP